MNNFVLLNFDNRKTCYAIYKIIKMYYFNFSFTRNFALHLKRMIKNTLKTLHLSQNEIKIFLTALQHGPAPASIITKRCNLPRHTIYQTIETLRTRGLMGFMIKNNVRYFSAIDPEVLLERYEAEITHAKNTAYEITQMLIDAAKTREKKQTPFMAVCMEGKAALKSVYDDILRERQSYYNFSYGLPLFESNPDAYRYFHQKRLHYKMHVKKIMPEPENPINNPEKVRIQLLEVRYIPQKKFPFKCDIRIYSNKIALIDNNKETPNIILITSTPLTEMFKAIFELSWEATERYKIEH